MWGKFELCYQIKEDESPKSKVSNYFIHPQTPSINSAFPNKNTPNT